MGSEMMKFKDEQGNFVTPRKGDYVLASDIKDEDMHNRIREAFGTFCTVDQDNGKYIKRNDSCYCENKYGVFWSEYTKNVENQNRRIIPHQKTLFEAACEAEDGTRFKVGTRCLVMTRHGWGDDLVFEDSPEKSVPISWMYSTDFERLPSGPKKRTLHVDDWVFDSHHEIYVPFDMKNDAVKAFKLMSDLMQREGAQIGRPGYVIKKVSGGGISSSIVAYEESPKPTEITFQYADQCLAAWKAECPEMFE